MGEEKYLYLVGWVMPLAILELKRSLSQMADGETLQVILEGQSLLENIKKTMIHSPDLILDQSDSDGRIHLTIQKGATSGQGRAFSDAPTDTGGGPV